MSKSRTPLADRFWSNVHKTDGCWLWTGTYQRYGVISRPGRQNGRVYAHRLSWEIHNGEVPEGLSVCHTCDNTKCVNPKHLFLGTHNDNMKDCLDKGRHICQRPGWRPKPNSKIDRETAEEIRRRVASGEPQKSCSVDYGIAQCTVSQIVNYKLWK